MFVEVQRSGVPWQQYHDWPDNPPLGDPGRRISRSELMWMLDCGEMFLAGGRNGSSASLKKGSLVDCMLLTPQEVEKQFVRQPLTYKSEKTTGRGKEKKTETIVKPWTYQSKTCQAWRKEQEDAGKQVISDKEFGEGQAMAQAVRHTRLAEITLGELIEACETQVVLEGKWFDEHTEREVPVRAMLDLARGPVGYDLKTAQEVNARKFQYSIRDYHYDVQSWMYSEMLKAAEDADIAPFAFICVRNTHPYLTATYSAGHETREAGQNKFKLAMRRYCDALNSNQFTGYTNGFEPI